MTTPIRIEIPEDIHEDDWKEHLQERIHEFKSALDLSAGVDPNDHHVEIHEIEIDSLEICEDEVVIGYVFNWSVYFGCDDKNSSGDEDGFVSAKRDRNVLRFLPHIYPERRSTFDEF